MKCPICRKEVSLPSPYAPFCSERCKLIDLGNWASERYVVSTPLKQREVEQANEAETGRRDEHDED